MPCRAGGEGIQSPWVADRVLATALALVFLLPLSDVDPACYARSRFELLVLRFDNREVLSGSQRQDCENSARLREELHPRSGNSWMAGVQQCWVR